MKIKADFVTNSSSTSFVVMGTEIKFSDIDIKKFQKIKAKETVTLEDIMEDPYGYIDNHITGTALSFSQGSEYGEGNIMIGLEYTQMDLDETLGQFKERSKRLIKEKFGVDVEVHHIQEAWMDN
jgi:hypothetical protein